MAAAKKTATKAEKNESATVKAGLKTGTKIGTTGTGVGAKKTAAGKAPAKAPKEKKARNPNVQGGEGGRKGSDATYTVVAKENPFREGTTRYDLWAHIKASKNAADARALDGRISIGFLRELHDKEVIKLAE